MRPRGGDAVAVDEPVRFDWNEATDPEVGDRLTYCVHLASDSLFSDEWLLPGVGGTETIADPQFDPGQRYWWRVVAHDRGGNETVSTPAARWFFVAATSEIADGDPDWPATPRSVTETRRAAPRPIAWPNPTRGGIWCQLEWPDDERAVREAERAAWGLQIVDLSGRVVAACPAAPHRGSLQHIGPARFLWDGSGSGGERVPSGVYWARPLPLHPTAGTRRSPRGAGTAVLLVR
ncbi:MAG: hypothetical protein GF330_09100 [Candidatus Eisenbacteria bacterium]|nr:hypothetical protein [Candidatus Eisenbacteria bacterium]